MLNCIERMLSNAHLSHHFLFRKFVCTETHKYPPKATDLQLL
jgi:hypothetical protein